MATHAPTHPPTQAAMATHLDQGRGEGSVSCPLQQRDPSQPGVTATPTPLSPVQVREIECAIEWVVRQFGTGPTWTNCVRPDKLDSRMGLSPPSKSAPPWFVRPTGSFGNRGKTRLDAIPGGLYRSPALIAATNGPLGVEHASAQNMTACPTVSTCPGHAGDMSPRHVSDM